MRIVCWNVQGGGPDQENKAGRYPKPGLVNYLEKWKADVAIFLEPPQWMKDKGRKESILFERKEGERGHTESRWRLRGYMEGDRQGHVFVAYKDGDINVEIKGGVPLSTSAQDNHLVFIEAEKGDETRLIATCHAPFANNSGEASQYCINAMRALKERTPFGVLGGSTDIWMGDLNTYGTTATQSSRARQDYKLVLAEPSSGFGPASGPQSNHSPLDKIFVRASLIPSARGRIAPKNLPGPKASEATDIVEDDWPEGRNVPCDHLPIYIDTSPMEAVPQQNASTSPPRTHFLPPDPPDTRKKQRGNDEQGPSRPAGAGGSSDTSP